MANTFLNLPAPAGNGAGAAVDVSSMGALKSIVVQGVWPKPQKTPTVNIEMNNAAVATDGSWAPVCTFYGTGIQTVQIAARWMRARVSNYNAGAAPAVNVGGVDDGSVFAELIAPAGNGLGAAVDISALPALKTLQIGGRFSGSIILELSEDAGGTRWAQWEAMQAPGQQTQIAVAYWARLKRVGVPSNDPYGVPVINLGAALPGSGGDGTGVNVQDDGTPVVTPATTLNFTGAMPRVTDGGGGLANIDVRLDVYQSLDPTANPSTELEFAGTVGEGPLGQPIGLELAYVDPRTTVTVALAGDVQSRAPALAALPIEQNKWFVQLNNTDETGDPTVAAFILESPIAPYPDCQEITVAQGSMAPHNVSVEVPE